MNTKQTISKKYGKNACGKVYPFSSTRQDARGARQQAARAKKHDQRMARWDALMAKFPSITA